MHRAAEHDVRASTPTRGAARLAGAPLSRRTPGPSVGPGSGGREGDREALNADRKVPHPSLQAQTGRMSAKPSIAQFRHGGSTAIDGMRAARREHAGRERRDRVHTSPGDRDEPSVPRYVLDLAGDQRTGIGVARTRQDLAHRAGFDDGPSVHHAQLVAELCHQAKLVRDEHDGAREIPRRRSSSRATICLPRSHRAPSSARRRGGGRARPEAPCRSSPAAACRPRAGADRQPGEAPHRDADALQHRFRAGEAPRGAEVRVRAGAARRRCVPTVKRGFSAVIGSWKIIAMRRPRKAFIPAASRREDRSIEHDLAAEARYWLGGAEEGTTRGSTFPSPTRPHAENASAADIEVDAAQDVDRAPGGGRLELEVRMATRVRSASSHRSGALARVSGLPIPGVRSCVSAPG